MTTTKRVLTVTMNPAIDQTVFVPGFSAGEVNRVERTQSNAGGKGVNVASLLADYGCDVAATGLLGSHNPTLFEELFTSKKIRDLFVRVTGSTRVGIKIINEKNAETTDINFPGLCPESTDMNILHDTITRLAKECEWIVFAGSLPNGVRPDFYRRMIEDIKTHSDCKIALDTSGPALTEALKAMPDLIKPNKDELVEMLNIQLNTLDAVAKAAHVLLDRGIKTVVVSMGAEGALAADADCTLHAQPGPVTLLSTVGAGDAMVSGMVAGDLDGRTLEERIALATAFSVAVLSQVGSDLPSHVVMQKVASQVVVTQVK